MLLLLPINLRFWNYNFLLFFQTNIFWILIIVGVFDSHVVASAWIYLFSSLKLCHHDFNLIFTNLYMFVLHFFPSMHKGLNPMSFIGAWYIFIFSRLMHVFYVSYSLISDTNGWQCVSVCVLVSLGTLKQSSTSLLFFGKRILREVENRILFKE